MIKVIYKYLICLLFVLFTFEAIADRAGPPRHKGHDPSQEDAEFEIEVDIFDLGDSLSRDGNGQAGTTGIIFEAQYEIDSMVFSFGYERWAYSWVNPDSIPFSSKMGDTPFSNFTTLQFGLGYEQEIGEQWEIGYYIEAESSFELETSRSYEYEVGIDFNYEQSETWSYTFNINAEYLYADGVEFGIDVEIEWNHDSKDGWSGEFELSSEFPESILRYHFTPQYAAAIFAGDGGTNTIRLSDSSNLIPDLQGGYLEDEYSTIGLRFDYEFKTKQRLSFSLQQNSNRQFSFTDKTGNVETIYNFGDSVQFMMSYTHEF